MTRIIVLSVFLFVPFLHGETSKRIDNRRSNARQIPALPLVFEPNVGQAPAEARFLARAPRHSILLTADGAVLQGEGPALSVAFAGAWPLRRAEGLDPTGGVSNYYRGNKSAHWRAGVPHYARVAYSGVYPGIDVVWYAQGNELEYDFIVKPGADPSAIALVWTGADAISLDESGDLIVRAAGAEVRQRLPRVYQQIQGRTNEIAASYRLHSGGRVTFDLARYERGHDLVIDPVVSYSTFLGVNPAGVDLAAFIATGPDGSLYIAGSSPGPNNVPDTETDDVFIARLNPTGSALLYSTFLGGHDFEIANYITTDADGNAYVGGVTESNDFTTTAGAFRRQYGGGPDDGFVAKFSPTGALIFSTLLGGSQTDDVFSVSVDAGRNVYATGGTASANFPTTSGAFDTSLNLPPGGPAGSEPPLDAFIAKLNPDGSQLLLGTYLGGTEDEHGRDIKVDASGNIYVTGYAGAGFPTTPGVFAPNFSAPGGADRRDVFVAKLNAAGSAVTFATYVGGSGEDIANGIALGSTGTITVAGYTSSGDFPTTAGAYDRTFVHSGAFENDGFVTRLNADGTALVFSTFLGGPARDRIHTFFLDTDDSVWVAGSTASNDFPVTADALGGGHANGGLDMFLTRIAANGATLGHSSVFGGPADENLGLAARDSAGNIYLAASLSQAGVVNIPTVNPTTIGTTPVIWLLKISEVSASPIAVVSAASYNPDAVLAPDSFAVGFGVGLSTDSQVAPAGPWPQTLAGSSVRITDSAATARLAGLVYVFPTQLSFVVPSGTANGTAIVEVVRDAAVVARGTIQIQSVAPALFSANATGGGVVAANQLHYSQSNEFLGSDVVFNCPGGANCVPKPINLGPEGEQVILELYGTGIRGRSALSAVTATAGGVSLNVLYAGPQPSFDGLDQVNVLLSRQLIGRGEINLNLIVDGKITNTVRINVQ